MTANYSQLVVPACCGASLCSQLWRNGSPRFIWIWRCCTVVQTFCLALPRPGPARTAIVARASDVERVPSLLQILRIENQLQLGALLRGIVRAGGWPWRRSQRAELMIFIWPPHLAHTSGSTS